MVLSNLGNAFYLLSFVVLISAAHGGPLFHICSNNKFQDNDPYQSNLNRLLSDLASSTPFTGFSQSTQGQNSPGQTSYGIALCTANLKNQDCQSCIQAAAVELQKSCGLDRAAIIWYDNCLLKYSNNNFFGHVDYKTHIQQCNFREVQHPAKLRRRRRQLFRRLIKEASASSSLFASGDVNLGSSTKIYALVQCTRDLSRSSCKKCLEKMAYIHAFNCLKNPGGKFYSGSCNLRYEIYPFVNF
ncbi:hypothetical protein K2173_009386 [Erythroxylum novogranatense]|uniref:Gnk2-homologous domain-containing protein n=1 Tax=Erythroxylum novogranatense TaxID=1862640 RepID=A0AAV8U7N3_9ROSI|nr:hypothetical protein K2173_009386 [Erythroxylum novogranatense]